MPIAFHKETKKKKERKTEKIDEKKSMRETIPIG
jgi:hypothetical protein